MPFGEEILPDGVFRTAALKYGVGDNVRQKFTGYQRDDETGLDFAEARYYNNKHGRFTAVDPLLPSGKSANPQTFNRYVYVLNNPLVLTDPNGLQAGGTVSEEPDIIRVVTVLFRDLFNALQERANYLLNGASNLSNLDQANGGRIQNRIDAARGDQAVADALNNTIVGNQGPTTDAVIQQTTDSVETANTISNTAIEINFLLLALPTPSGNVATLGRGGQAVIRGAAKVARGVTEVANVTAKGSRYTNLAANLGSKEFQSNLISNGYKIVSETAGKNGSVTVLSNGTKSYTIYTATSTGEVSAQITNAAGEILSKIRLIGP